MRKPCTVQGCDFQTTRNNILRNHLEQVHLCRDCGYNFLSLPNHVCPLAGQRRTDQGPTHLDLGEFIEVASAHLGYLKHYRWVVPTNTIFDKIDEFYDFLDDRLNDFVTRLVRHYCGLRLTLTLFVHLVNLKNNDEMFTNIVGESCTIVTNEQVEHAIVHNILHQISTLNSFTTRGSLWNLNQILRLDLNIGRYDPLMVGARQFKTPAFLRNKKGIIVLKSPQDECFLYAIACARFYTHIPTRYRNTATYYTPFLTSFDFTHIPTPTPVDKIHLFEKYNDIGVNVHFLENKKVYPLRSSKNQDIPQVDLLIISKRAATVHHYATIYNLNKFLGACRINRTDRRQRHYCRNCYNKFTTGQILEKHYERCMMMRPQIVKYPSLSKFWQCFDRFKKFGYCQRMSYVGIFDFECFLAPHVHQHDPTVTHIHIPNSFGLIIWGPDSRIFKHEIYNGENAVQTFFAKANEFADEVLQLIKVNNERVMTDEEEVEFQAATTCYFCYRPFTEKRVKTRHHSHTRWFYRNTPQQQIKTNYIGCICNFCNLQIKVRSFTYKHISHHHHHRKPPSVFSIYICIR